MLYKFLDSIVAQFTKLWDLNSFYLASLFWAVGLISWISNSTSNFKNLFYFLDAIQLSQAIFLMLIVLILVGASANFINSIRSYILRILEGFWPKMFDSVRNILINRQIEIRKKKRLRWHELSTKFHYFEGLKDPLLNKDEIKEYREYLRLDDDLNNYPLNYNNYLPTNIGNRLKAAEEYPRIRYGLDTMIVWPRLWLLLPDQTQKELTAIRLLMDKRAVLISWFILINIWSIWSIWILLIGVVGTIFSYRGLVLAIKAYSDLLRATFDIYRFNLYESLHFGFPTYPKDEKKLGLNVTRYLKRGIVSPEFNYFELR